MTARKAMARDTVTRIDFGTYWDDEGGMHGVLDVMFDDRFVHSSRMDEAAWPVFLERILVWKAVTLREDAALSAAAPDGKAFHLLLPGRTGPGLVLTRRGGSFLAEAGGEHALVPVTTTVPAVHGLGRRVYARALANGAAAGDAYASWRDHA